MNVVLVCSHPADSVRMPLAARPARLAQGLRDMLQAGGHAVELVILPQRDAGGADDAVNTIVARHRARPADVLHALDAAAAAAALRARGIIGVPTVFSAQPSFAAALSDTDRARWVACMRASDALTVPTAQDARSVRELGVVCDSVHVVAVAAAGEVPVSPGLSSPSGERLVSVLSGAHAWGGTIDVVAALARVRDTRLVVAGRCGIPEGPQRLQAVAEAFGVADRVTVTGWLSDADTDALVDRSAVVVAPRRSLTSGAASLRAMGRGRPVIAYDSATQAEIVVDGETGLLVPTGSRAGLAHAMSTLVDDPFRQEAMGQAGQDRALARFGAEPTTRALDAAYAGTRRLEQLAS